MSYRASSTIDAAISSPKRSPTSTQSSANPIKAQQDETLKRINRDLKELKAEEQKVQEQSIQHQNRQQALIRSGRLLEHKLEAFNKNVVTVSNRIHDMKGRVAVAEADLKREQAQEQKLVNSLTNVQLNLQNLDVDIESLADEKKRLDRQLDDNNAELREIKIRRKELGSAHDTLVTNMATLHEQRSSLQHKEEEFKRTIELILKEKQAISHETSKMDSSNLDRQAEELRGKQVKLAEQVASIDSKFTAIQGQLKDIVREQDQIAGLLPTLEAATIDVQKLHKTVVRKLAENKKASRRMVTEEMQTKRQLAKSQQATSAIQNNLNGMRKVVEGLEAELVKLQEQERLLSGRLADVRSGEDTLGSRISQDFFYLQALEKKRDRLLQEKAEVYSRVPSATGVPDPPLKPPPPSALRGSSAAISASLHCIMGQKMVEGTLTVTSFLVIFESTTNPAHRFCVDMQDVASCRIDGIDASVLDERQLLDDKKIDQCDMIVSFVPQYKNRFLFNEQTGTQAQGSVFGNNVRFRSNRTSVSSAYRALNEAILAQEALSLKKLRGMSVSKQRRRSNSSGSLASPSARVRAATVANPRASSPLPASSTSQKDRIPKQFRFMVRTEGTSSILSEDLMQKLLHSVPKRYQLDVWRQTYSISTDGCSLTTLYSRASKSDASLIIMRDSMGKVFGGFSPDMWTPKNKLYYGGGESYVFDFAPENQLNVYAWSGKNDFFMLSNDEYLAMGGGEHYAFRLDRSLEKGISGPCSTYNSPRLSASEDFVLYAFELWSCDM